MKRLLVCIPGFVLLLLLIFISSCATQSEIAGQPEDIESNEYALAEQELRERILTRAREWLLFRDGGSRSSRIDYSEDVGTGLGGYRADCSGYVSYAWDVWDDNNAGGYNTEGLMGFGTSISIDELLPGDILVAHDDTTQHVVIFVDWVNLDNTEFFAYEENGFYGYALSRELTLGNCSNDSCEIPEEEDEEGGGRGPYTAYRHREIAALIQEHQNLLVGKQPLVDPVVSQEFTAPDQPLESDPVQVQTQVAQDVIEAPKPDVCFNILCFSYPEGEDYGVVPSILPAELETEWFSVPAHDDFTFYDYPLGAAFHKAHISIYPVAEFLEINPAAEERVAELETFLALKPKDPEFVPFALPIFNAAQMITVQVEYLTFEGGSGVRFVSQYGQAAWPINNRDVFYAYQGLTDDGLYLISAVLPVSHPSLPADGESFIGDEYDAFINAYEAYLLEVENQLDLEDPESFFPELTALDEMLETIHIATTVSDSGAAVSISTASSPGFGQSYSFTVDQEVAEVYWESDGSARILYMIIFANDASGPPIEFVDIGTPNDDYNLGYTSATINNQPISHFAHSEYISTGIELGLGSNAIQPGQQGTVVVDLGPISGLLNKDSQSDDYASARFAPNYFDKDLAHGSTDLTVIFHLPPGVQPDEPHWHASPGGWPNEPRAYLDNEGRVVYQWYSPSANAYTEYQFGASFPLEYVRTDSIQTSSP